MAICQDTQESRLQSWRQRLAPRSLLPTSSRLNGLLARGRQASRPRSPRPKSQDDSLPRANTWPLLIKQRSQSLAVRQAAEARKRSAAINKQIAADFKGREESVLVWGDYEAIVLVVENFMAAASSSSRARSDSQASAAELDVDLEAAAVPIRRNVLLEARRFVESLLDVVEEHSDMEQAVGLVKRMKAKNATLDDKMVLSIEELWSSEAFRTACTAAGKPDAYAHLVMDAVRRISAENYMPTLADHRRFFQDRRRMMFKGTFKFKRLSVSLADMNCMSSGIKSVRSYFEDTTILLFLFDLSHCVELFDNDDESHHGEGRLRESLTLFEHLVNTRHFPQASMILVLWNVAGFKDKLDGKEPSSSLRINNRPDGESAAEQAINHVIDKFTAAKKSGMPLHTRVAELSDTAITTTILAIVKDAMLARMLTVSGVFRDKAST
ncbi:hypothetical protein B0T26DRAFT_194441 [Lasiosphaeria miniovina]|uniref:Uncharacterized protein n=1 Tax=Lasiosphaeria miniovina TaxID=1954250 RepID=A0AA40DZ41_9PEZI|nr:uncharacterized protein B0T26DRAFT_194441 [Lasiosphaeria miniovina]KAK0721864.1 hypothetical protein B0T26DRAFT_194441 [Lasiosphaeria miniovina]